MTSIQPNSDSPIANYLVEADTAYVSGDLITARTALSKALEIEKTDANLLIAFGNILLKLGEIEQAYQQFFNAAVHWPAYAPAHVQLAGMALVFGCDWQASYHAKQALVCDPQNQEAIFILNVLKEREKTVQTEKNREVPVVSESKDVAEPDFNDEIEFWDKELSLQGQFSTDILNRLEPDRFINVFPNELLPYLQQFIHERGRIASVLDVGSGPLSMLAYASQQNLAELVASDPLADVYVQLLQKHGHRPTTPLVKCYGESLSEVFDPESFDIVWMRNALDHTQSPLRTFQELVAVLRPGGYLFISGFTREATYEQWRGLHKHDLYLEADGKLVCRSEITNPAGVDFTETAINAGMPLELISSSKPSAEVRDWMWVVWKKVDGT